MFCEITPQKGCNLDKEDLVDELKNLRKGRGASPARLAVSPLNLSHEAFVEAVQALGDGVQAQALQNAYAIGMTNPYNLTRRRQDFAVRNNCHGDTVERWENEMIDELAIVLLPSMTDEAVSDELQFLYDIMSWVNEESEVLSLRLNMILHERAELNPKAEVNDIIAQGGAEPLTPKQSRVVKLMEASWKRQIEAAHVEGADDILRSLLDLMDRKQDELGWVEDSEEPLD